MYILAAFLTKLLQHAQIDYYEMKTKRPIIIEINYMNDN